MTKISCGVIIRDNDRMLIARPTNHSAWNIPKGINEPDDVDFLETALRETEEEIGIDLSNLSPGSINYLGEFAYYSGKRLVLFDVVLDTEDLPAIEDMECKSMFYNEKLGIYQPELSKFKYISIEDYGKYVNKSLKKVLDKIF